MTGVMHSRVFAAAPETVDAARLIECLALLKEKPLELSMAVLNLDPRLNLRIAPARKQREGIFRHARSTLAGTDLPFLTAAEARGLFSDERRKKGDSQLNGYSLFILAIDRQAADLLCAAQSLVVCVPAGSSALPFIYPFCEAMRERKRRVPIEMIVLGEARLEKAAEYFAAQKKELAGLDADADLRFCGSVHFDPEEKQLADSLGLPFLELFPSRATHGEVLAIGRRLFKHDLSEDLPDPAVFAETMLSCLNSAD